MSTRVPRIGVVGAGRWGMNLVRTLARLGVLAAACDPDLRPLEAIRSEHGGVRIFCDPARMFSAAKLHAVAIAAPAQLHAELALAAIDAGLDVFVEKPLALNLADAQRIVDAARASGVRLVVGHLLLYHPAIRLMLQMVQNGAIGELRHVRTRRSSWGRLRAHEDVWWSFAPHDVAVMLQLFGEEPAAVTRSTGAFVRPHIADVAYADFAFSAGRTGHVAVSWIDPEKASAIDAFGSQGVLAFRDGERGPSLRLIPCGDRLSARGEPELWREEARALDVPARDALEIELREFCRAVRGGRLPVSHGDEGLAVVRALAMAQRELVA